MFFKFGKDGGQYSTVWGYWLIEAKALFSIVLLRFEHGTREAFHSHAFNCVSWVLSGRLIEHHRDGRIDEHGPSLIPFITRRSTFHKVHSEGRSWVLSFRGPWLPTWREFIPSTNRDLVLTNGRQEIAQ